MSETHRLGLPLVAAGQAQKHVPVNEALTVLDALLALHVADRHLAAPPEDPNEGAAWIVAAGGGGDWAGRDGEIAFRLDGGWRFVAPVAGLTAFIADEAALVAHDGTNWVGVGSGEGGGGDPGPGPGPITKLQEIELFGLAAEADGENPFSAYLNKALWAARRVADEGDGDLRYTFSKEGPAHVLSLLFQSDFEARAEFGLIGDDDLVFKVTDDGENWTEAIRIDPETGLVSFPAGASVGPPPTAFVALDDAATIAWDMSAGTNFAVTLGGDRTLGFPANPAEGRTGALVVDASGHELAFGSGSGEFVFEFGQAPAVGDRTVFGYLVLPGGDVLMTPVRQVA